MSKQSIIKEALEKLKLQDITIWDVERVINGMKGYLDVEEYYKD